MLLNACIAHFVVPDASISRGGQALSNNLVPLVLAESSSTSSALEAFLETGGPPRFQQGGKAKNDGPAIGDVLRCAGAVTDPALQCVSLRLCALEQKRQREAWLAYTVTFYGSS